MTYPASFDTVEIHPINIAQELAATNHWKFARDSEAEIVMEVAGQWRTYSISMGWSAHDETLRLLCTFSIQPLAENLPELYELLNLLNHQCWFGAFSYYLKYDQVAYRYALALAGEAEASAAQVAAMIGTAVFSSEQYYPVIQSVLWDDMTPEQALRLTIDLPHGNA